MFWFNYKLLELRQDFLGEAIWLVLCGRPDKMITKALSGFTIYEINNPRTEPLSLTTLLVGEITPQGVDRLSTSSRSPALQGSH